MYMYYVLRVMFATAAGSSKQERKPIKAKANKLATIYSDDDGDDDDDADTAKSILAKKLAKKRGNKTLAAFDDDLTASESDEPTVKKPKQAEIVNDISFKLDSDPVDGTVGIDVENPSEIASEIRQKVVECSVDNSHVKGDRDLSTESEVPEESIKQEEQEVPDAQCTDAAVGEHVEAGPMDAVSDVVTDVDDEVIPSSASSSQSTEFEFPIKIPHAERSESQLSEVKNTVDGAAASATAAGGTAQQNNDSDFDFEE